MARRRLNPTVNPAVGPTVPAPAGAASENVQIGRAHV